MANKIKSKGTALLMEITSVYTAIPLLISLDVTGEKSETFPSETLDGSAYKTRDPTGYVEPPIIKAEGFYDPDDTTIQAVEAKVAAPAANNFKVTYTDGTPTSDIYSVTGYGLDKKAAMADAVKATYEFVTSGAPS